MRPVLGAFGVAGRFKGREVSGGVVGTGLAGGRFSGEFMSGDGLTVSGVD